MSIDTDVLVHGVRGRILYTCILPMKKRTSEEIAALQLALVTFEWSQSVTDHVPLLLKKVLKYLLQFEENICSKLSAKK